MYAECFLDLGECIAMGIAWGCAQLSAAGEHLHVDPCCRVCSVHMLLVVDRAHCLKFAYNWPGRWKMWLQEGGYGVDWVDGD
jgi:hypothetical protein